MSDSYTKLFASITESTVWREPAGTRLVWITMLAKCNRRGEIYASVPGLADLAKVSIKECVAALATLLAPDPWSRTKDHDGRRIAEVDGGWRLLNHAKFDRLRSEIESEERERERKREWDRENRPSGHARSKGVEQSDDSPTKSDKGPTKSVPPPAPAVARALKEPDLRSGVDAARVDPASATTDVENGATDEAPPERTPIAKIVDLYHAKLPRAPRVEKITKVRAGYIRQRWREDLPSLEAWANYLEDVGKSKFLTGQLPGRDGKPPFVADLEWLTRPSNFAKVAEGKYHR